MLIVFYGGDVYRGITPNKQPVIMYACQKDHKREDKQEQFAACNLFCMGKEVGMNKIGLNVKRKGIDIQ